MRRIVALLEASPAIGLLLATACSEPEAVTPLLTEESSLYVGSIPLSDAHVLDGQVFPAHLGTTERGCHFPAIKYPPILDEHSREWYSSHLGAANEPPLPELAATDPRDLHVRFIWLRSFHQPIIIRIHGQADGGSEIEAKRLSGAGGYEPGEVNEHLNRDLSAAESLRFDALLDGSDLMSEPSANCDIGIDGAQWILEVADDNEYAFFERWSPREGAVRDVALEMLALTGWDIEPLY